MCLAKERNEHLRRKLESFVIHCLHTSMFTTTTFLSNGFSFFPSFFSLCFRVQCFHWLPFFSFELVFFHQSVGNFSFSLITYIFYILSSFSFFVICTLCFRASNFTAHISTFLFPVLCSLHILFSRFLYQKFFILECLLFLPSHRKQFSIFLYLYNFRMKVFICIINLLPQHNIFIHYQHKIKLLLLY